MLHCYVERVITQQQFTLKIDCFMSKNPQLDKIAKINEFPFIRNYLIGSISGSATQIICVPFDVIRQVKAKRLLRNQINARIQPRFGYLGWAIQIIKKQGLFALWKNYGIAIHKYSLSNAWLFAIRDSVKDYLNANLAPNYPSINSYVSGGVAGFIILLYQHPLAYSRILFREDIALAKYGNKQRSFNSLKNVINKKIANQGIHGIYRGFFIASVGTIVYRSIFFGLFDNLSAKQLENSYMIKSFINAITSTYIPSFFYYPCQTIKKLMWMQKSSTNRSLKSCLHEIYGQKLNLRLLLFQNLYKGFSFTRIGLLSNSILLTFYDRFRLVIQKFGNKH